MEKKKLKLFSGVKNKKVLELGCAAGKSLEYLVEQGASEVWGLDISSEQINVAKDNKNLKDARFFVSPMEENPGIPENYFDYVFSLYSIGFSSNIFETIKLSSQYLKSNGTFIISWTHPFFNCLDINEDKVIVKRSYNDEEIDEITKGPDKIKMMQYNLKISTLVNMIIKAGLVIDRIIEEKPVSENHIGNYKSTFWDPRKINSCPTTLIIIAHKN
ncbi:MAG: class I SAM-dependent methyltransferase [Clostridia bacterium]|nr:class I SAM-dependent methyltransferase [Clostridia bacterium]